MTEGRYNPDEDPYNTWDEGALALETVRAFVLRKQAAAEARLPGEGGPVMTPEEEEAQEREAWAINQSLYPEYRRKMIEAARKKKTPIEIDLGSPEHWGGSWLQPVRDAAEAPRRATVKAARKAKLKK